jgi:hypothetical protein
VVLTLAKSTNLALRFMLELFALGSLGYWGFVSGGTRSRRSPWGSEPRSSPRWCGVLARLVDGEPSRADDVAGIRWVSAEDIDEIDFAWEHDRNLVRTALEDGD